VFRKMFTFGLADPIVEKLLPDVDAQDPRAAIKPVLVINVDDLLVHLDFKPERGWKCQKRPGVDEFLKQMSQHYEVVFFCDGSAGRMAGITMKLDPTGNRIHKLFKEHTTSRDGHHVKDLQKLNRPLQRIILLDHNAGAYVLQPENAIRTYKWTGDTTDDFLRRVSPLLVTVARYSAQMQGTVDLRNVLKHYKPQDKQDENSVAEAGEMISRFEELIEKQR
jgi:mitochondrial import inner membrane translocase subunit TIM50